MAWFESVCWHHHRSVANNRNMDVCPSKYTPKNFRCTEISYYLCVSCWSFVVFSTNSVWPSWYYNIITYTSVGSKHTILEVTIFFYSGISKKKKVQILPISIVWFRWLRFFRFLHLERKREKENGGQKVKPNVLAENMYTFFESKN